MTMSLQNRIPEIAEQVVSYGKSSGIAEIRCASKRSGVRAYQIPVEQKAIRREEGDAGENGYAGAHVK
jgi:hypothetical protein